jgi:hypothetical protein
MKIYAGPACKTEYQMCLKACKLRCPARVLLRCLPALEDWSLSMAGAVAANRNLSGAQLRAKFAGMQLTDEVHYRLV